MKKTAVSVPFWGFYSFGFTNLYQRLLPGLPIFPTSYSTTFMRITQLLLSAALLLLVACGDSATSATSPETSPAPAAAPEVLQSKKEMAPPGEWVSLFNGEDLSGWHTYGKEGVGAAWKIDDGAIHLDVANKNGWQAEGGGDIVTDKDYANYELELEWKIGKNGNSGIIYNIVENGYDYPWLTGPEMQVLDNDGHADGKIKTHRAGDLYDMISVAEENVKPVGEWNMVKLVVLNGKKQVEYVNKGPEWEAMIANSKFKDFDAFGKTTSGKISLQDHGDAVWYRNIRIRELGS